MKTAVLATLLACCASPLCADVSYTDYQSWMTATGGTGLVPNLNGLAAANSFNYYVPSVTDANGITYSINGTVSDGNLYALGTDYYYPGVAVISSQQGSVANDLLMSFAPSQSFGFFLGGFSTGVATVQVSDGFSSSISSPGMPSLQFFGIVASAPITSVELINATDAINVGVAGTATPEPRFYLFLGALLSIMLPFQVRRGRNKSRV